jgi:hypothetical protein
LISDDNLSTSDLAPASRNDVPATAPNTGAGETADAQGDATPHAALFSDDDSSGFRERWMEIQTGFVDEPRQAVEQADALVAQLMKRLAETFADERAKLEAQWGHGENVSTEELRVALQRYRSFFERLLST